MFFVMGLNGFLNFLPQYPAGMPTEALAFSLALAQTGYLLPLANRFVPLALLAPVVVDIFAFHAFLAPSGLPIAIAVAALEIALTWSYRDAFKQMLRATRA